MKKNSNVLDKTASERIAKIENQVQLIFEMLFDYLEEHYGTITPKKAAKKVVKTAPKSKGSKKKSK